MINSLSVLLTLFTFPIAANITARHQITRKKNNMYDLIYSTSGKYITFLRVNVIFSISLHTDTIYIYFLF